MRSLQNLVFCLRLSFCVLIAFGYLCFAEDYHLERIFELLKLKFSINSVLVEPGLTLIPAMLSLPNLIDLVVITTGSKVIGSAGRTPHWSESTTVGLSNLQHVDTTLVGHDVVTVLTSTNSTRGAEK